MLQRTLPSRRGEPIGIAGYRRLPATLNRLSPWCRTGRSNYVLARCLMVADWVSATPDRQDGKEGTFLAAALAGAKALGSGLG